MSSYKSQKPELIAIYRLEFYKKQNNWRLSSSRKAKKSPQKSSEIKKSLNVTYNIEHPDSEEQTDPHNIAFVDSDSDKTTQTKCIKLKPDIKNKELSQEWQESINIWPSSESWDPYSIKEQKDSTWDSRNENYKKLSNNQWKDPVTAKTNALKRLEELQKAANLELEEQPNAEEFLEDCPDSLDVKNMWVDRNVECEWGRRCYQDCAVEAGILNIGHVERDIWTQAPQGDVIDGLYYPEVIIDPEDWQQPRQFGDVPWTETEPASHHQEAEDWSVDSEGEFQRGAHAAPHSSETELALPPGLSTPDVSFSSLSRLSSSQLLLAARQHSLVLRRLLQESEHRQKLRTAASLNSFSGSSFEEFPTRDIGPHNLGNSNNSLNRNIYFKDVFITGSYKNVAVEVRGRGRGRIIDTPLWR
ncbi:unnamed protein product [Euphydryas editha]|uniref:Uncharacterized protein n=1 Tax=Euphydryas editha TaxID=104508 RepID=A0AAU9TFQ0_EUPED|nr:unnamed protein product [Euphydryas editha]